MCFAYSWSLFFGMRYLETLKYHAQWAHSNLKLFNIFVLNVTYKFSVLNRTVFSFLMFDTPAILCVYAYVCAHAQACACSSVLNI